MKRALPLPSSLLLGACLACATCACGVDEAPKELATLVPWFMAHYDSASDTEMASNIVALAGAASKVDADNPLKVGVGHLSAADIASLKLPARDLTRARGMFVLTQFNCTLAQLEKIVTSLNQPTLYPDTYTSYKRTYTSNHEDYVARKTAFLGWKTDLTASNAGTSFTELLSGGARFVPDLGKPASPFGASLVTRTWLTVPATSDDADKKWDQDYQVEVYVERSPGKMLHLFAAWRHIDMGYLSTDDDSMVDLMLGHFVDWDEVTEKNCAAGKS